MRRMHAKKFNYEEEIDGPLFRETVRLFNEAAATGLAEGNIPLEGSHLERFVKQVRHNNEVFSAFRVHAMQQDLAANMIDEKGNLRPFKEWVEKSRPNLSHYNKEWLRTEYDTAVIRAHRAADWMQFEAEKDVLPNLRWMPTTSPNADALHRQFWERKLTLPVDHPFWHKHKPGDRWNCKCHLEATDDPASEIKEGEFAPAPAQPGLKGNPAKDGKIFSLDHPYFAKSCATCLFGKKAKGIKAALNRWFMVSDKDCYDCQNIDESVPQKLSSEEKHAIYMKPLHEQFEEVYKSEEGFRVYRHVLKPKVNAKEADYDYEDLLEVAKIYSKKKDVYILPEIDSKETEIRSFLGLKDTGKNPDFYFQRGYFVDVKRPMSQRRISRNIHRASYQGAIACVMPRKHWKITKEMTDNIVKDIEEKGIYQESEIHFVIDNNIYVRKIQQPR